MNQALRQDFDYVEEIVQNSSSSFSMGMKILPKDRRGYLYGIYAYCRHLDDIADDLTLSVEEKLNQIAIWENKVEALKSGSADCAITRVLTDAIEQYAIPIEELLLLIEGMKTDILGPVNKPTWEELYQYCRQVAVSVGILSLPLFGRSDEQAKAFAIEVGYALQLTNILRDVKEDAENNRFYLPKESCEHHSVEDINSPNLHLVLAEVAAKTQNHYDQAKKELIKAGRHSLQPAIVMMGVYEKLFEKLQNRGWHTISPRMRLSKFEKTMLVMKFMTGF